MAGNTVVFKPSSASPLSAVMLMQAYEDAGVPKGVVNIVMGPGETVGQALQDHPGIDGIVFTGSYEVGMRLFHSFSTTWPAAVHRRDGWQEPGHRDPPRRPRRGGRGDHARARSASAARSARPTRASTSSGRSTTSSSPSWSRRPSRSSSATRSVRANWLGPIIDQKAVDRHQAAVAEARRDGTVFTGGEQLTDGDLARGFYVEPTVVGGLPASHRVFRDEFFAPLTAVHAVDSLDEALTPGQRHGLRPDRRRLQRGSGRGPDVPRPHPGRRPVHQPPGRRDDRCLAGRPGVRWLEGQRLDRQGRPVDVLRRAVPARADPHGRRLAPRRRGGRRRHGGPYDLPHRGSDRPLAWSPGRVLLLALVALAVGCPRCRRCAP